MNMLFEVINLVTNIVLIYTYLDLNYLNLLFDVLMYNTFFHSL